MDTVGIFTVMRRTGLRRTQIVYLEQRGDLGVVTREKGRRRFSPAQVAKLEKIAACRAAGLRLDEASVIAGTGAPVGPEHLARLHSVVASKARAIRRELAGWEYVFSLIQAADRDGDGQTAA